MNIKNIRNFAIIAHIDHGKSTLADRFIELSEDSDKKKMKNQTLDSMDIERERGITIKAQTVRMSYKSKDGEIYQFNLIDTPGHVDFSYEVSRSLAACEGSLLVVDASQGVEAQTLANVYKAIDNNHEIVVVLNKIDLPAAEPERVKNDVEEIIGIDASNAIAVSAKTGYGIKEVFEEIVKLPSPVGDDEAELKALLVDSWYDNYLGVIVLVRVKDGKITPGMQISMMATGAKYIVEKVGIFLPEKKEISCLKAGEIGFITASIRHIEDCAVGDTITSSKRPTKEPLPGFKPTMCVVFCSIYPESSDEFEKLKVSLSKLRLNDSSFTYEIETSAALGMGFRCGFLGLLHLEIIQNRIEGEFNISIITTAPSVSYEVFPRNDEKMIIHNPIDLPEVSNIDYIKEPWVRATIICPDDYVGEVMNLCLSRRGQQIEISYSLNRVTMIYDIPLSEIIFDFYDKLKSITSGYASFDCEPIESREADIVKVLILVNGEPVYALSRLINKGSAEFIGRSMCAKLKDVIKRQQFKIIIQAKIGGKIIARETVNPFRKDVTGGKCTGKDRKQKKLDKQRKGKKRMLSSASVEIPKDAYKAVLQN